jgi:hypothetical protein
VRREAALLLAATLGCAPASGSSPATSGQALPIESRPSIAPAIEARPPTTDGTTSAPVPAIGSTARTAAAATRDGVVAPSSSMPAATPARAAPSASTGASAASPQEPRAASTDPLMTSLLASGGSALRTVMAAPEKFRFQVLYTPVLHDGAKASLERHGYRTDAEYFFPASSMKVPIALAAYARLASLRRSGRSQLTRDAAIRIFSVTGDADPYGTTLARETWRSLVVSDNFAANRSLAFVGHREVHDTLWGMGLFSTRIRTGFATGDDIDPAELSPRIEVLAGGAKVDELPARRSDLSLPPTEATGLAIGEATVVDGRRVAGPLSFAEKNAMRLRDLQDALVLIVRPELASARAASTPIAEDDRAHLRQALGTLPSASGLAGYDRNVVADYQFVPFLRGLERVRSRERIQIFSKVGQAYGFLVANAYIVDRESGRSFFLATSVYANPDEVMNDDKYAYETIAFPVLADVGEVFARHAFGGGASTF